MQPVDFDKPAIPPVLEPHAHHWRSGAPLFRRLPWVWIDAYRPDAGTTGTVRVARLVTPVLVRRLLARQYCVAVVVSPRDTAFAAEIAMAGGMPITRLERGYGVRRIGTILLREALLHAQASFSFHNLALSKLTRVPSLVQLHDVIPLQAGPAYGTWLEKQRMRLRWALTLKRTRGIVYYTEASKTAAAEHLGKIRVPTFYAPLASNLTAQKSADAATSIGLDPNTPYLVVHGGTEPRKNVTLAAHAHLKLPEAVRRRHPLVILGGQWCGRTWAEAGIPDDDPHVRIPGHVPDGVYGDILASAAAILCPSRYEGFDVPVLDSMRFGVPCICSDIPAHLEVSGGACLDFADNNVASLTSAMHAVLTDEAAATQHRQAGLERASSFSVSRCVDGYEKALLSVLEPPRTQR